MRTIINEKSSTQWHFDLKRFPKYALISLPKPLFCMLPLFSYYLMTVHYFVWRSFYTSSFLLFFFSSFCKLFRDMYLLKVFSFVLHLYCDYVLAMHNYVIKYILFRSIMFNSLCKLKISPHFADYYHFIL